MATDTPRQLPLFSDSIAFIRRIHRVVVIPRHDPYLAAPSRFYGQGPSRRDGFLCIGELSGHDERLLRESPSLLPLARSGIAVGIALRTMRSRLSLLLETGPLKGPVLLSRPMYATCTPIYRIRETEAGNCFRFDPLSSAETEVRFITAALVDAGP